MRYFLRVDSAGYIHGFSVADEPPTAEAPLTVVEHTFVPDFPDTGVRLRLLGDGSIVATAVPVFPPEVYMTWDYTNGGWVDPRDLVAKQAAKWEAMKLTRDEAETAPFTWNSMTFDADRISQSRIQGAVQLATMDANLSVDWTLADNSSVTLTASDLMQLGGALGVHVTTAHVKGRLVRDAIDAATTEAELDAVTWPA